MTSGKVFGKQVIETAMQQRDRDNPRQPGNGTRAQTETGEAQTEGVIYNKNCPEYSGQNQRCFQGQPKIRISPFLIG